MTNTVSPYPKLQFFDNAGAPAAGYKLYSYYAGTTTKLATTSDATGTPNSNPVTLDSAGRATVFLGAYNYKLVLATPTDTDPPASPIWTVDGIAATPLSTGNNDVTGTIGETVDAGKVVYCSDGSGSLTAGRWYKADGGTAYSSSGAMLVGFTTAAYSTSDSGVIRLSGRMTGLSALSAGTRYYAGSAGALTTTPPTFCRPVLFADASTSGVILQEGGEKAIIVGIGSVVGDVISTGVKMYVSIPMNLTIVGWTLLADQTGSIVIDVWKDVYANFPPLVGDTIAGSEKPTLSAAQCNTDVSLTTWTTSVSIGDVLAFNVDSCSSCKQVTLTLHCVAR